MVSRILDILEDASQGLFQKDGHAQRHTNGNGTTTPSLTSNGNDHGSSASGPSFSSSSLPEEPIKPVPEPDLRTKISSLRTLVSKSLSPLPQHPAPPATSALSQEPSGLLADVQALGFADVDTLLDFLQAATKSAAQDDSEFLLERLVSLLAKLPSTSGKGRAISGGLIHQMWSALDHPTLSSLDERYKYREADGSHNNMQFPSVGAAGTPYARSTPAVVMQRPDVPEPSLLFDALMSRGDTFEEHPNKISSVLFYMATIITHDIFQSDGKKSGFNLTSSYLDLSPLYGRNREEQLAMRTMSSGLLKPDCFSSKRVHGFPPGVGVLLIMFNRFHNYVVTQLASINENNRFSKEPSPRSLQGLDEAEKARARAAALEKYDEDLFQTGRLVTCGLYVNIILRDYVRTILNVNRVDSAWALDPRTKSVPGGLCAVDTPEATGNQVSVEFNFLYRWHSSVSPRDARWTEDEFRRMSGGKSAEEVGFEEFLTVLHSFEAGLPEDPASRPFHHLDRNEDGTLPDEALVGIFADSVEDVAGSFGANRVPPVLKHVEVLGILQARRWNVATLNEFRSFFGLKRHATFEDINPDPAVAHRLRHLYDSPDAVELYPGLVVEKPKPPMEGSGICLNYTISRAILSDAVALVRGDRFYTVDYTPRSLTNWGYAEAGHDPAVDNGHVLYKLVYRAFPDFFRRGSVYAHFPLVVPSENEKILRGIGKAHMYNTLDRPAKKPDMVMVRSYDAVKGVLENKEDFKVVWGDAIRFLTFDDGEAHGRAFCLAGDGEDNARNRQVVRDALYAPTAWEKEVSSFYTATASTLLRSHSHESFSGPPPPPSPFTTTTVGDGNGATSSSKGRPSSREVDVVRDVINASNARFCAALFSLPIKTPESPLGILTAQELYLALTAVFTSIFFDADPSKSLHVRHVAKGLADALEKTVRLTAHAVDKTPAFVADAVAQLRALGAHALADGDDDGKPSSLSSSSGCPFSSGQRVKLDGYGRELIGRLLEEGRSVEECVWGTVMPLISANVPNQSSLMAQCLDFYLEEENKAHLEELYRLAHEGTAAADEKILKYMLEGCRLRGTVAVYRTATKPTTLTDHTTVLPSPSDPTHLHPVLPATPLLPTTLSVQHGTKLLLNLATASLDPAAFPDPLSVRLDRPLDSYIHFGWGPHQCAGMELSLAGQAALFKALVGLKGLRRAQGARGRMKSMPAAIWNGQVRGGGEAEWSGMRVYMNAEQSGYWPVPGSMRVVWDE